MRSIRNTLLVASVVVVTACGDSQDPSVTGAVRVTVATQGPSSLEGYQVKVGGSVAQAVALNGAVTVADLPAGEYTAELQGISPDCAVAGRNPATVRVVDAEVAEVTFAVVCPVAQALLRVRVQASGADIDPDGFLLTVGPAQSIVPMRGTTHIAVATEGTAGLTLTGLNTNCTVVGGFPEAVNLIKGQPADLSLRITCTATTGAIRLTVTVDGGPTQQGYSIATDRGQFDLWWFGQPPAGEPILVEGFSPGLIQLVLQPAGRGCTVDGGGARSLTITVGLTTDVAFHITCARLPGLIVTVTTTGANLDPDGYALPHPGGSGDPWWGSRTLPIPTNGTVRLDNLGEAAYGVAVSGVAANCSQTPPVPATINVGPPGSPDVTLNLAFSCR